MSALLILLATVPAVATAVSLTRWRRLAHAATVVCAVASLVIAVTLVPAVIHGPVAVGFLRADALSVVFVLGTALLYVMAALYTIGYLPGGYRESELAPASYHRRLYVGLNVFAWSMICAPIVDGLALIWIAVEITTVVSALLVALDASSRAAEAAWKYVLLASAGLGVGLLATIVMYYAGASVLGTAYDLAFEPLLAAGTSLPHGAVRLALLLAVVGYGTKVGLFPVHTWLPDAHSEAPTPVSALLSGSLLAVSLYAVIRYFQIAVAALGPTFPRTVLLVFGIASLALAALYLLQQRNVKRLLAYSSIEHMGVLAIGIGLGAPVAAAGVLLHVIAHAAAKGNAFFGAGVLVQKFDTKDMTKIRSALTALPVSAPLFLFSILALSAVPPFAMFRSEFQIVAGGMTAARGWVTAVLVVLVTVAFVGLSVATTRMMFSHEAAPPSPGEPSRWMVAAMVVGMVVLVVLGVHPPGDLVVLFQTGAAALVGAA